MMFFCPVAIAKHPFPSNVLEGLHASLRIGERSLIIEHSLGRMPVYGKAGEEQMKRTSKSSVLLDDGDEDVATKNRPLGENDR